MISLYLISTLYFLLLFSELLHLQINIKQLKLNNKPKQLGNTNTAKNNEITNEVPYLG